MHCHDFIVSRGYMAQSLTTRPKYPPAPFFGPTHSKTNIFHLYFFNYPVFFTKSSFVPPLIYAFMGSSRDIAIGPVAVVSLLLGFLLSNEIDPTTNPNEYRRLAFTATFFAGIIQATLGILRLGFLIDFLSHAAVVGFNFHGWCGHYNCPPAT
uniref:Sulfate transporter 1.3-like n=2 Tax=Nicotiana TaxID=4085 RepID=A0A1S4CGZ5_TOBAC|nr:PREDICTED: sulfate transporter 1.3-like [Nicotiana sylvestris]XP_016500452.1 PREDICTED: sulfate transporter 1.3-like [Nicotiana tabacum]